MSSKPWIKFNQDIADEICDLIITSNKSLAKILIENEHLPKYSTIYKWLKNNESFAKQYARAKEDQADFLADEILEIADSSEKDTMQIVGKNGELIEVENKEWVNRSRLRVDSRKWVASKLKPKKYGDTVDVTSGGEKITIPVIIDWSKNPKKDTQ